jgi:hypothetical protein
LYFLGYTTLLLEDAKTFSNFAKKKNVDVDDVKIAIQLAQDGVFFRPPSREVRYLNYCNIIWTLSQQTKSFYLI